MVIYYFGCWGRGHVGHHLWTPQGDSARGVVPPWQIDGLLCPGYVGRVGKPGEQVPMERQVEGVAALHHAEGWTALAFWDRSVDRRGGSHSTFLAEETLDFDAMVAAARAEFPGVWSRYTFPVVPAAGGAP